MQDFFSIALDEYKVEDIAAFCGPQDAYLDLMQDFFSASIVMRENEIRVMPKRPEMKEQITQVIQKLFTLIEQQKEINERDVIYLCKLAAAGKLSGFHIGNVQAVGRNFQGKSIYPKTLGQRYMCQCMQQNDIVFASGVAGTGKTYLAVVYAVSLLKKGEVKKIILTRPAVEAGESLGFLPGDLKEKVDPYLRPLYDALYDTLGQESVEKLLEKEVIEIAPLAYMRGRTLNEAFIILDEAQNSTRSQMKMFLTRMGFHSKIVITGDITQIDLIRKKDSGLLNAKKLLDGIEGIGFVELTSLDVVRHPLVQKIIERYEQAELEADGSSVNENRAEF